MRLSDYISQVQFLVNDQNNADFSASELTAAINNARKAVALDFHCCRETYISSNPNSPQLAQFRTVGVIQNQELYPLVGQNGNNGQVVGAVVTSGGANYSSSTAVTFDAGPTGSVQAAGVAVITGGVITGIDMTAWGQGYLPALPGSAGVPKITITDPGGGSGATATATMFNNVFDVISIHYLWGNQRYMLAWRAFTMFQAYMRSQLFFTQRGLVTTINQQGGFVLIQPPPDQPYVTEWDVICVDPLPLVNPGDVDTQVRAPYNDAVQYWAAHLCLNKLQNFGQAEYYLKLYSARVPKIIIGAAGIRIPNPYNKNYQRRQMR
jgi:hypothetical protein